MEKYRVKIAVFFVVAIISGGISSKTWAQDEFKQFKFVRSSGLFSLPVNAQSVDWSIINDAQVPRSFRVTVYKAGVGEKTVVPPGALTFTLDPNFTTHNANSVGPNKPFVPGFYYEVVVESDTLKVLPSVQVWQDYGNTVIPGTLISSGDFIVIKNVYNKCN